MMNESIFTHPNNMLEGTVTFGSEEIEEPPTHDLVEDRNGLWHCKICHSVSRDHDILSTVPCREMYGRKRHDQKYIFTASLRVPSLDFEDAIQSQRYISHFMHEVLLPVANDRVEHENLTTLNEWEGFIDAGKEAGIIHLKVSAKVQPKEDE